MYSIFVGISVKFMLNFSRKKFLIVLLISLCAVASRIIGHIFNYIKYILISIPIYQYTKYNNISTYNNIFWYILMHYILTLLYVFRRFELSFINSNIVKFCSSLKKKKNIYMAYIAGSVSHVIRLDFISSFLKASLMLCPCSRLALLGRRLSL